MTTTLFAVPLVLGSLLALGSLGSTGCMTDDKGDEEAAPVDGQLDGKLDGFASPTDHGVIAFNTPLFSELTAAARFHTWTFTLTDTATVDIATSHAGPGRATDTVLYLYKQNAAGRWGSSIARNDDVGLSNLSRITRSLGAGEYRVLVKGFSARNRGTFGVAVSCAGAACGVAAPSCLFGDSFNQVEGSGAVRRTFSTTLHTSDIGNLRANEKAAIIAALHESSHTDVVTIEEAFAAADQQEINKIGIWDENGSREFLAYEYGAGDSSYGAIFAGDTTERATAIHDGDFYACVTTAETCALGHTFFDMRQDADFTVVSQRKVTAAGQLTGTATAQALIAIQAAYEEATSVANGLTLVDDNEINVYQFKQTSTGAVYDAFEVGAGDNSFGAVFKVGTVDRAARINDGDFYDCAVFD